MHVNRPISRAGGIDVGSIYDRPQEGLNYRYENTIRTVNCHSYDRIDIIFFKPETQLCICPRPTSFLPQCAVSDLHFRRGGSAYDMKELRNIALLSARLVLPDTNHEV